MSEPERDWWRACFPTFMRGVDWTARSRPIRWLRRSWVRVLKWTLVILLLLGVAHTIASIHVSERLGAKFEALKAAKGGSVRGWDLRPPDVPDEENAAPFYVAAAAWVRLHERAGGWDPSVLPGSQSRLSVGYRDLWTRDGGLRDLTTEEFLSLRRMVALDGPALDLIRHGAGRPHCQFERNWYQPLHVWPHESDALRLQKFLAANALVAARTGQSDLALECLRLGFVVARQRAQGPAMIDGLFAARGTASYVLQAVAEVLPKLRLSEAEAQALAGELARLDLGSSLPERWNYERLIGRQIFGAMTTPGGLDYIGPMEGAPVPRFLRPFFWRHYGRGLLKPWLDLDQLRYLEEMDTWDAALAATPRERAGAWYAIPGTSAPRGPWWAPVTRHIAWGPVGSARAMDCWDASCDLLSIVVGLEYYRQQHGRYPASLAELRRSGWAVPRDRFAEADFTYRRRGETFLLYSIGPNLKDDGGQPSEWPFFNWRKVEPGQGPTGDIVWQYRPVMPRRSPHR